MSITLGFDVYGTLVNTGGVINALNDLIGEKATDFSDTWRNKQLEYSFRRGLMRSYVKFSECTRQALDYTCDHYKQNISSEQKELLLEQYKSLPAFDETNTALSRLQALDFRLFAFSNGDIQTVDDVLSSAGLRDFFIDIISVDDLQTFKPNPDVYHYFLKQTNADITQSWLISGNPFDVIGAVNAGMKAAWIRRSLNIIYDTWGIQPTLTVSNLNEFVVNLE